MWCDVGHVSHVFISLYTGLTSERLEIKASHHGRTQPRRVGLARKGRQELHYLVISLFPSASFHFFSFSGICTSACSTLFPSIDILPSKTYSMPTNDHAPNHRWTIFRYLFAHKKHASINFFFFPTYVQTDSHLPSFYLSPSFLFA